MRIHRLVASIGVSLLLAVAPLAVAGTTRPQVAPDPIPEWSLLRPVAVNAAITRADQLVGQFWRYNDRLAFVWDIAFARLPGGQIVMLRGELQYQDGTLARTNDLSLRDLPRGTEIVEDLADIRPQGLREIFWADGRGEVLTLAAKALRRRETELGGTSSIEDPNARCTVRFTAHCLATTCTKACGIFPSLCGCEGGSCVSTVDSASCSGTCPTGTCGSQTGGGCGCSG